MSAPQPPGPVSTRVVLVATVVALLVAVVAVWLTVRVVDRPLADGPPTPITFGPIPARTAGPAPITPVPLTEMPMHQRGPQALRTPEETR